MIEQGIHSREIGGAGGDSAAFALSEVPAAIETVLQLPSAGTPPLMTVVPVVPETTGTQVPATLQKHPTARERTMGCVANETAQISDFSIRGGGAAGPR